MDRGVLDVEGDERLTMVRPKSRSYSVDDVVSLRQSGAINRFDRILWSERAFTRDEQWHGRWDRGDWRYVEYPHRWSGPAHGWRDFHDRR